MRSNQVKLLGRVVVLFSSTLCLPWSSFSQSSTPQNNAPLQSLADHHGVGWNTAANRWQLAAVDPSVQTDTVSPDVRAQRDAFWKKILEPMRGAAGAVGYYSAGGPEFPVQPGDVWVIAKFEGFHVFEVNHDPELIYTEMNFRVDNVFRQPDMLSISPGSFVDVGLAGGRIISGDGKVDSPGWLRPVRYGVQPGRQYLIQFLYEPKGGVFLAGAHWDVSSGKVETEGAEESERAASGKSAIAGLSVAELVNRFPSILPDAPKK
jgi:hypothetical protein